MSTLTKDDPRIEYQATIIAKNHEERWQRLWKELPPRYQDVMIRIENDVPLMSQEDWTRD